MHVKNAFNERMIYYGFYIETMHPKAPFCCGK
jgi:hypothetical protein